MKTEKYVTFEQARALKRLGFDWECDHYYALSAYACHLLRTEGGIPSNFNKDVGECLIDCSAPALHIAAKWLREVKKLHVCVRSVYNQNGDFDCFSAFVQSLDCICFIMCDSDFERYKTYEAALSKGITAAIKILEGKQ